MSENEVTVAFTGDSKPLPPLSQYDRLQRIAMSYGWHIRKLEPRYEVINIHREQVIGGAFGRTLDEVEEVFTTTLNVINSKIGSGELVRLPGGLVRMSEAAAERRANAERKAWEAEHLGPDGDYFDLGDGKVVKRIDYDPSVHGAIVRTTDGLAISQESLARAQAIIDAKIECGELVRLPDGRIVTAAEYDPDVHGPKDCGHTEICDHLS